MARSVTRLNTFRFFISGFFEKVVYISEPRDLEEFKHRIVDAESSIPAAVLENVFSEFEH